MKAETEMGLCVSSALRELEVKFTSIILPEGIKKHLQGEPSVLEEIYINNELLLLFSSVQYI